MATDIGGSLTNSVDGYVVKGVDLQGVYTVVKTIAERDNIISNNIVEGSLVYVSDEGKAYRYTDSSWVEEIYSDGISYSAGSGINFEKIIEKTTENENSIIYGSYQYTGYTPKTTFDGEAAYNISAVPKMGAEYSVQLTDPLSAYKNIYIKYNDVDETSFTHTVDIFTAASSAPTGTLTKKELGIAKYNLAKNAFTVKVYPASDEVYKQGLEATTLYISTVSAVKENDIHTSLINVKVDDNTIKFNTDGQLYVAETSDSVSSVNNVSAVSGNISISASDIPYNSLSSVSAMINYLNPVNDGSGIHAFDNDGHVVYEISLTDEQKETADVFGYIPTEDEWRPVVSGIYQQGGEVAVYNNLISSTDEYPISSDIIRIEITDNGISPARSFSAAVTGNSVDDISESIWQHPLDAAMDVQCDSNNLYIAYDIDVTTVKNYEDLYGFPITLYYDADTKQVTKIFITNNSHKRGEASDYVNRFTLKLYKNQEQISIKEQLNKVDNKLDLNKLEYNSSNQISGYAGSAFAINKDSVSSVNNVSPVSGNVTIDSDDIQYADGGDTYYSYEYDDPDGTIYIVYCKTEQVAMNSTLYEYDEDTKTFTVFNDDPDVYIDSVDEDTFETEEYGDGPYEYHRNGAYDISETKTVTEAIKDAKTVYSGTNGIVVNDKSIELNLTDIQKSISGIYGYNPTTSAWEYTKSPNVAYEQSDYAMPYSGEKSYIQNKPVFTSGLSYITPEYNEVHIEDDGLIILDYEGSEYDTCDLDPSGVDTLFFASDEVDTFYIKFPLKENTTINDYDYAAPIIANNKYAIERTVVKDKNILKAYPGTLFATFYSNENTKSLPKVDIYTQESNDSILLKAVCTPDENGNYYNFELYFESPVLQLLNKETNIVKLSLTNAQSANAVYGYNPVANAWQIAGGTGGTYTNLTPVPKDIGGITKGETFNGLTYQEMFDKLLYPYIEWNFGTFSITAAAGTYEYGTSKTVSAWKIDATSGTKAITSLTFTDSEGNTTTYTDPAFPVTYTLGTSVTLDGTTNYSVTAEATDGKTPKSTHADINFTKYKYYATSTSDTTIPTTGDQLSDSGTNITTTAGQYIWAFTPTNTTSLAIKQYVNGSWSDVAGSHYVGSVTFTLKSGATLTYYAYVTAKMVAATGKYKLA